jgi:glycosyltransferase involved in cell wall biosynthesis
LVILEESRPGTDHARRTGIFAARYNYFLFCDDDNWLSPEYIALGFSFLDKRPKVGLVGGRGTAVADIPLPIWFEDVSGYYAATSPAKATQDMTHWGIWGAGMMGRTNLVRAVLPNHLPLLVAGRVGTDAGLGEDGEICMRVALAGYQVWYYDELVFEHCIIPQRLSLSYKAKLISKAEKAAEVIGTYTRAVRISSLSSLEKVLLFVRHFSKWMCPTNANKKFTADYCYYLTGMKIWETPLNTQIRMLAKHITKIKNTTSFE